MKAIPRVVPCLLLRGTGVVKTVQFKDPRYVGDAFNALRIFNEKEVDEILVLDTQATTERRPPRFDFIRALASECFMPLGYGGGIRTLGEIETLFAAGVEKVALNTVALEDPRLVATAAAAFGSQSIVVSIDARRDRSGRYLVHTHAGRKKEGISPVEHARRMEQAGAGEILIHSMDRDGTGDGYDLALVHDVANAVSVPVVASGGAGTLAHLKEAVASGASAVSAGSLFVFFGRLRAVLITYPSRHELVQLFSA